MSVALDWLIEHPWIALVIALVVIAGLLVVGEKGGDE